MIVDTVWRTVAGRHAAGKTTRRIPLTREPSDPRTTSKSHAAGKSPAVSEPKPEAKSQYSARHALNRRRRPVVAPLATAAALTIAGNGPYIDGRCIDLSRAAFAAIENPGRGVMTVRYEVIT